MKLAWFQLPSEWIALLRRLPGWREDNDGSWTDGCTRVIVEPPHWPSIGIGFYRDSSAGDDAGCGQVEYDATPSGIPVRFTSQLDSTPLPTASQFLLNHVAVNVSNVNVDGHWFQERLGQSAILAREGAWNPVTRDFRPDLHLFRHPSFYITLRGGFAEGHIDHIGWMTSERGLVNEAAGLIRDLGWQTIVGPLEIDGSFLVHFRGPDHRVHDFFCPNPSITSGDPITVGVSTASDCERDFKGP